MRGRTKARCCCRIYIYIFKGCHFFGSTSSFLVGLISFLVASCPQSLRVFVPAGRTQNWTQPFITCFYKKIYLLHSVVQPLKLEPARLAGELWREGGWHGVCMSKFLELHTSFHKVYGMHCLEVSTPNTLNSRSYILKICNQLFNQLIFSSSFGGHQHSSQVQLTIK